MHPRHIALAILLSVFWGLNFVVISVALTHFPPLFLAMLRFTLAALPVLFLPRPPLAWRTLILIGMTLFVGQFALFFPAMAVGMPPGLASIALQAQAFITIAIAAAVLGERPTARQIAGAAVASAGLVLVGTTVGTAGVTVAGFVLLLGSAFCWSTGNVLLRRAGAVDMLSMMSWLSLIAVPPVLLLSLGIEGPARIGEAVAHANWLTVGAVFYIAFVSTTFGYAAWGHLMKLYPAATAAPFSLLVPVSGTLSAALLVGETFGTVRLAGMGLIMVGLAFLVLGPRPTAVAADPA
ncbi:MAG: EamA family transporter [Bauldia sp.]|nr:EamA family transporter [Bauldia sp.]